jgi:penicillin amidase
LQEEGSSEWKSAAEAYLNGVNHFIEEGKLPPEYTLLGITPEPFTINDMHNIVGYMAFTFAMGLKTDPLVTKIQRELGPDYAKHLSMHTLPEHHVVPSHLPERDKDNRIIGKTLSECLERLPVPLLQGSNGWVIGPEKTSSGSVLFCNDTHIGFSQPSVWYEAHLEYPGYSYYGYHLGGFPFGLVGHSGHHTIGLTMFENDDHDFYEERRNPENPQSTLYGNGSLPIIVHVDTIQVKNSDPDIWATEVSAHGPLINKVVPEITEITHLPVASWWVYLQEPTRALEALWKLNHAGNIHDAEDAVRLIHAPGLNIMYGDKTGNIAWWAAAKLPIRPEGVHSKMFIDGSNPANEPIGWVPFEENPMSINPPSGFIASANNQPDTLPNGIFYPGYYYPGERYRRIAETIQAGADWDAEKVKALQLETVNDQLPENAQILLGCIDKGAYPDFQPILKALTNWTGSHAIGETAPTLYYKWLYHTLYGMMADELGEEWFQKYLNTFLYIRSTHSLLRAASSPWWDNIHTETKENRDAIVKQSLETALQELTDQWGKDSRQWQWGKATYLEHPHALGTKKPLDKIFNVKAGPVPANEESINKFSFLINKEGRYAVKAGPALRNILDFAHVENAEGILPTGQSGNLFSPFYRDQTQHYTQGRYRPQLMNKAAIQRSAERVLRFVKK